MTDRRRDRLALPVLAATVAVAVIMGGLLFGYEPVGGDPDRLYRPVKSELTRALSAGSLPFWSDRFGLGVPLVAESHVAAFYPPNWLLYGALDVSTAYRLSMWLHYVALAAATYAYARRLGLGQWGAALAAASFSLCGSQAIHSSHEWFYTALPFLPLALYFAEAYLQSGRASSLALLALTSGVQLTVGHFQIAGFTAGLVCATAVWRCLPIGGAPRSRGVSVAAALACAAGIAAVQLVLSWDYAQLVGFMNRPLQERMSFVYPPAHWFELAIPEVLWNAPGGPDGTYWWSLGTTRYEASLYVGTVTLIFACVGLTARHDRSLALWRFIVPLSAALATMPVWWPAGYQLVLQLPGLGYFRAPGRYTLVTSLGLTLLAGRGFDRALSHSRFVVGLAVACVFAAAAVTWAMYWTSRPDHAALGEFDLRGTLAWAGAIWVASAAAVLAWRRQLVGPVVPFAIAVIELGVLYYHGPTTWSWSIDLLKDSPVLRQLAQETSVGTIAGNLDDLPVRVGHAPTYPYLGMRALPPASALENAKDDATATNPLALHLLQRLGMTHAVWTTPAPGSDVESLYVGADEVLDRLVHRASGAAEHHTWHVVRYAEPLAAHVALRAREAPGLQAVLAYLAQDPSTDTAWFMPGDRPSEPPGQRARTARIVSWTGLTGEVEHDGTCDVVIRRSYAPGWMARVNDAAPTPVLRVDGGLQGVRLTGMGPTRVSLHYEPPHLRPAAIVSVTTLCGVLLVLARKTTPRDQGLAE